MIFAKRGFSKLMLYVHGLIGIIFIAIALIHVPHPTPLFWLPYALGAFLTLFTLRTELSVPVSRVLALSTTVLMFFFFASFFVTVPKLAADWYTHQHGWEAVCLILGAFAMIPILSDYSCRLKAECLEARRAARKHSFFSVPEHIRSSANH